MDKFYTIYEAYAHIKGIWETHGLPRPTKLISDTIITYDGITEQVDEMLSRGVPFGMIWFLDTSQPFEIKSMIKDESVFRIESIKVDLRG